jgi:predicted esterase
MNIPSTFSRVFQFILFSLLVLLNSSILYPQEGIEVLSNGQFTSSSTGWTLKKTNGAVAAISLDANSVLSGRNSLRINITSGGGNLNAVRLFTALAMQEGRYYNISFMAKSDRPCSVRAGFHSNLSQGNTFWPTPIAGIQESPQHYGPFSCQYLNSDSSHLFSFHIGGTDSVNLWIDSVSIFMTDDTAHTRPEEDLVKSFVDTINQLAAATDHQFLKLHYKAMCRMAESKLNLLTYDYSALAYLLDVFDDTNHINSPRKLSSYENRKRPYVISWVSPTDGKISHALLVTPAHWNPDTTYPLYVSLHGLWPVADNPILNMAYNFLDGQEENEPFDNGYLIFPWGRGNLWYEGIGETDVWEAMNEVQSMVKVDPARKYLLGFSMGGYGAWYLGQKSAEKWAALGIYAGALANGGYQVVDLATAEKLKDVPTFFIVGDQDGFRTIDQTAYQLLQTAGNKNISFNTFSGGHEYLFNNLNAIYGWMKNFVNTHQTAVEEKPGTAPTRFILFENYPNPFNPNTLIRYEVPVKSTVNLRVYDVMGREVATLVNETKGAGRYEAAFDASRLSSGIYFCRMSVSDLNTQSNQLFVKTNKLIFMK